MADSNKYDDHVLKNVARSYLNGVFAVLETFIIYALSKVHFTVGQHRRKSNMCKET